MQKMGHGNVPSFVYGEMNEKDENDGGCLMYPSMHEWL